jgi:hypothetical protein
MTQRKGHVYLCHALRLVHALRRGLLVGGHSGFYMGNLVHREDAKLVTCLEGIFTFSEIAEKGVKYINPLIAFSGPREVIFVGIAHLWGIGLEA